MSDSDRDRARSRGSLRGFVNRALGRGERLERPRRGSLFARAVPVLALGVVGLAGVQRWGPGAEHLIPGALEEVEALTPSVELPMEVNARVEKWMRRFMTDDKATFEVFLSREGRYSDMIRGKLRDRGMPEDLLYLAMIESGFSARATSRVSAAGVWQFMRPTARQYGLRIDRFVDERRDPVKATDAALDYLQWLHARYDSWYLAAAAYNAGPGRVDRILRRHADGRTGDEAIYWEIIDHLPRETRDYVPKLLAATALAREAERYGFAVDRQSPYAYDRVWVPAHTSLAEVARSLGVSQARIRDLNPHLVQGVTPPGRSYGLRVPPGSSARVIANLGSAGSTRAADDD